MSEHRPRIKDKFWDRNRFLEMDAQPNGYISDIDWDEKEITVMFYDKSTDCYSFDDIEDCWEHLFGGCYMIYPQR